MFLIGVGSYAQLLNYTLAIELNPEKTKRFAVAFTNFLVFITGAITQTFVGYLLHIYNNNYQTALAIFPLCFLLGFIFTLFIKEKRHISPITYQ